jgi:Alpha amylase, C-terminal all-beta domain
LRTRNYRVGLPSAGRWEEVLNTDSEVYGGSGVGNLGAVTAVAEPWRKRLASITLRIPPLGAVWLTPAKPPVEGLALGAPVPTYCMWACGVATHPSSPETKIIVLQCGPQAPSVYTAAVRVQAQDLDSIQKFTNDFLTGSDFFPDHGEAVAPGFPSNGDEVRQAAKQLHDALHEVIQDGEEGDDWATVPFLGLQLTYPEVDAIRKLDAGEGARAVLEAARVNQIDGEAKRLFGIGRVDSLELFSRLVDAWRQGRPDAPTRWVDELSEQVRVGSHWRLPRFRWQLLESVDDADRAKYAPILSRVRSVPRQRCHQFDIYFSKFDTDEHGALRIGFVNEPQAAPGAIPAVTSLGEVQALRPDAEAG